ncbi:hypothetical protein [Chryseobacterium scophthalmum]|nr:hypothetical protein [Chryseobacterium scophthalmum]
MKKTYIFLMLMILVSLKAQDIPKLILKSKVDNNLVLPVVVDKNDLAIIINYNGGWTAFDRNIYYIFKNNGDLKIYKEESPKPYIKNPDLKKSIREISVSENTKDKLFEIINSKKITDFQKYSQNDFKIKQKDKSIAPPSCMISDSIGYKIWFIQNNKQNSYGYYAPEYYLEKCTDKTINKVVLKKFLEMLNEIRSAKI